MRKKSRKAIENAIRFGEIWIQSVGRSALEWSLSTPLPLAKPNVQSEKKPLPQNNAAAQLNLSGSDVPGE
jgi:hypothetical protein